MTFCVRHHYDSTFFCLLRTVNGHHKSAYGDHCTLNLPACCFSPGTPTQDEPWQGDHVMEKCNLHDLLPSLGMELDLAPLTQCLQSMNLTGSHSKQTTPCVNNSPLSSTCASNMKKSQPPPMDNTPPVTVQVAPLPVSPAFPTLSKCSDPSVHADTYKDSTSNTPSCNCTSTEQCASCLNRSLVISSPSPLCHSSPVIGKSQPFSQINSSQETKSPAHNSSPLASVLYPEHDAGNDVPSTTVGHQSANRSLLREHPSRNSYAEQDSYDLPNISGQASGQDEDVQLPGKEFSLATSTPVKGGSTRSLMVTSYTSKTDALDLPSQHLSFEIREGIFTGSCYHRDGSRLCKKVLLFIWLHLVKLIPSTKHFFSFYAVS